MYIGKTIDQERRYTLIDDVLKEDGKVEWVVQMNRDNCKYLILSMYQTMAEEKHKGFGKNKKPERDSKFPAEEAPHYGDAFDTLLYGLVYSGMDYSNYKREHLDFEIR